MTLAVPAYQPLEELPGRGTLVVAVGGIHDGAVFLLVPDGSRPVRHLEARRLDPRAAATRLLESLLDGSQLAEWRRHGRITVATPFGAVVLGRLYDLEWHSPGLGPVTLCVVPEGHAELPVEDVWVNLLLVLRATPRRFFEVARWVDPRDGCWRPGPVPLPPGT